MHQLRLTISDEVFQSAESQAKRAGYDSTEIFLTELLTESIQGSDIDEDAIFTPERLAIIDQAAKDIDSGGPIYSLGEVKNMVAETRREWEKKNNA